jgi:hypothetical protein
MLMPNNLSLVERKLFETDFFLDKIKECGKTIENFCQSEYYFSAFLSSSRSITFSMQFAFSKIEGFEKWYQGKQSVLKESDLAKFFKEARNNSQKKGTAHLNIGRIWNGQTDFFYADNGEYRFSPKEDMVSSSEKYFKLILKIISDFFTDFGEYVNPRIYYSLEKLKERDQSVKDLEMEVWGYNKWTGFGLTEEQSLAYILDKMLITNIAVLFEKYQIDLNCSSFETRTK